MRVFRGSTTRLRLLSSTSNREQNIRRVKLYITSSVVAGSVLAVGGGYAWNTRQLLQQIEREVEKKKVRLKHTLFLQIVCSGLCEACNSSGHCSRSSRQRAV